LKLKCSGHEWRPLPEIYKYIACTLKKQNVPLCHDCFLSIGAFRTNYLRQIQNSFEFYCSSCSFFQCDPCILASLKISTLLQYDCGTKVRLFTTTGPICILIGNYWGFGSQVIYFFFFKNILIEDMCGMFLNPWRMLRTKSIQWMTSLFTIETKNAPTDSLFGVFWWLPWLWGLASFKGKQLNLYYARQYFNLYLPRQEDVAHVPPCPKRSRH